jgi:tRNA modification GTPase
VLLLIDATQGYQEQDAEIEKRLQGLRVKRIFTKSDLLDVRTKEAIDGIQVSTKTGDGIDALIDDLTQNYNDYNHEQSTFIARQRHVEALKSTLEHLSAARQQFASTRSGELMAEDLRQAQQQLNEITGEFTTEDLLGRIFSSFCIGK